MRLYEIEDILVDDDEISLLSRLKRSD